MDRHVNIDHDEQWFKMSVGLQISNIGSEVHRAIRYRNKNQQEKAERFCIKAIQLLERSKRDPKNSGRVGELEFAIEELVDFFLGNNIYETTEASLIRYYDAFLSRI